MVVNATTGSCDRKKVVLLDFKKAVKAVEVLMDRWLIQLDSEEIPLAAQTRDVDGQVAGTGA
jgi:hypothetical protein